MLTLVTLLILYIQCYAQNYETGDNSTVEGCSSHCTLYDTNITCLNRSLHFYERILLTEMRNFIAVQINIDQWYKKHKGHLNRNYTQVKEDEIAKFTRELDPDEIINEKTIVAVVNALIDRVEEESESELLSVPRFSCPLPCEYRYVMWRYVFISSAVLNFLLILIVVPYIISVIRSDVPEPLVNQTVQSL